jgi:hypothetical protein
LGSRAAGHRPGPGDEIEQDRPVAKD